MGGDVTSRPPDRRRVGGRPEDEDRRHPAQQRDDRQRPVGMGFHGRDQQAEQSVEPLLDRIDHRHGYEMYPSPSRRFLTSSSEALSSGLPSSRSMRWVTNSSTDE